MVSRRAFRPRVTCTLLQSLPLELILSFRRFVTLLADVSIFGGFLAAEGFERHSRPSPHRMWLRCTIDLVSDRLEVRSNQSLGHSHGFASRTTGLGKLSETVFRYLDLASSAKSGVKSMPILSPRAICSGSLSISLVLTACRVEGKRNKFLQ